MINSIKLSKLPGIVHGFADRTITIEDINAANKGTFSEIQLLNQVHSNTVITIDNLNLNLPTPDGDAMITSTRGVGIGVRTADCIPILMADKNATVVAAVHAGWRGTYSEIVLKTLDIIHDKYGIDISQMIAVIGPYIKQQCYEVREDVASLFIDKYSQWNEFMVETAASKYLLDVGAVNRMQLLKNGVSDIEVIDFCTKCKDEFYSFRREGEGVGSQISFIGIM